MALYIVPTPIGNLKDITLRALEVLNNVDVILCEDTRTSSVLLQHYQIKKKLQAFHQHNEHQQTPLILNQLLQENFNAALISDAGTPGISDPAFLLIRACLKVNIKTECLPGATAFVPALVNSGIACNSFVFEGFLPIKKGRKQKMTQLSQEEKTIVIYESPKKIKSTIIDLISFFTQERNACLCREISKLYETFFRGSLKDILEHLAVKEPKGEIVLIIEGKK